MRSQALRGEISHLVHEQSKLICLLCSITLFGLGLSSAEHNFAPHPSAVAAAARAAKPLWMQLQALPISTALKAHPIQGECADSEVLSPTCLHDVVAWAGSGFDLTSVAEKMNLEFQRSMTTAQVKMDNLRTGGVSFISPLHVNVARFSSLKRDFQRNIRMMAPPYQEASHKDGMYNVGGTVTQMKVQQGILDEVPLLTVSSFVGFVWYKVILT